MKTPVQTAISVHHFLSIEPLPALISDPRRLADQSFDQCDLLGGRAATVGAGGLEHARKARKAWLVDERSGTVEAELTLTDVGVTVAVRTEWGLGVVEV
jgi:hypothetical protein